SEARGQELIQSKMKSCFQAALMPELEPKIVQEAYLCNRVQKVFFRALEELLVLRFDPAIELSGVSGDGHSTAGGFVPYISEQVNVTHAGMRIDTPEKFVT